MEPVLQMITTRRDYKILRELLFRNGKKMGYDYSNVKYDLTPEEIGYFIKFHDLYFIRDKNNSAILGSFIIFVLSPGTFWLFGFCIEESAKRKGIGQWAIQEVYKKYNNLFFHTRYPELEFYAKSFSKLKRKNLYIITDYLDFATQNQIGQVYIPNKSTPQEVFVSTNIDIVNLDKNDEEIVFSSWNEMVDLISNFLPKIK